MQCFSWPFLSQEWLKYGFSLQYEYIILQMDDMTVIYLQILNLNPNTWSPFVD